MTSTPAYHAVSNAPSVPVLGSEDPSEDGGVRWGEPGARSALGEGAKPPSREEREISWQNDSVSAASAQAGVGQQGSRDEDGKGRDARVERWRALGLLWQMSTLKRVQKCGRVSIRPSHAVGVRRTRSNRDGDDGESAVGYAGLASCGSVWACPRCSARIMAVRRLELGVLISKAAAEGLTVAFGTVTLRHRQGQPLSQLWDALTKGQRSVSQARKVRRLRDSLGRIGYVRATEVTHGDNGWHPHIHTIQLFEGEVSQEQLDELRDAEFAVWERQARNRGLGAPMKKRYELRRVVDANVAFSDYFAKGVYDPSVARSAKSVGFEMTGSQTKKGRGKGSRTPWQVLEDFGKTGDLADWDVFEEYEKASKGKRALVWSNGLKDRFGIDEVEDEEIAEDEMGDADDTLFWVTDWGPIAANSVLGGQLLGAVKRRGLRGGLEFCEKHGIPTSRVEPVAAG